MTRIHIVGMCFLIAISAAPASAQQKLVDQQETTVQVLDINGRDQIVERTITRRYESRGQEQIVVDIYQPNPVAPGDPMRLFRRIVTTSRMTDTGRLVTERTTYELDINGRLTPGFTEREVSTAVR